MGKVASDKCHKWVFKEPTECEPNISNYWQSSFDAVCMQILNFPLEFFCFISFLFIQNINIDVDLDNNICISCSRMFCFFLEVIMWNCLFDD